MKFMRKCILLSLSLLILLSLFGCGQQKNRNNNNTWNAVNYTYKGACSDAGYYYISKQNVLYYADFQSGVSVCLCNKANCPHDSTTSGDALAACEAFLNNTETGTLSTMFFWNSGLYYVQNTPYGIQLFRRNADGTNEAKVLTLCNAYLEDAPDVQIEAYGFTVAGNYVYYYAMMNSIIETEPNAFTSQTKSKALMRINLKTSKEEVLVEDSDVNHSLFLVAVQATSMIYTIVTYPDVNYDSENYSVLTNQCPVQIMQWSENNGESTLLVESTQGEMGTVVKCIDDELYCYKDNSWCQIDLATGEILYSGPFHVESGTLSIINSDYAFWREKTSDNWSILDLNTSELLPNEYGEYTLSIVGSTSDAFIMTRSISKENGAKDIVYMYIPLESLLDGLQEADIVELYTLHTDEYQ